MTPREAVIVAATLRQLAGWSLGDRSSGSLLELADAVEAENYANSWCCPMCEEVQCDGGCPLEGVRKP